MGRLKCDKCGRFTTQLIPIRSLHPTGGIDYEVCINCAKEPAVSFRVAATHAEEIK